MTHQTLAQTLFKSADKLRKNIDAAEYKHIVLGLVFLKYISDSFQATFERVQNEGGDTEDKDEYLAYMRFSCRQRRGGATLWKTPNKAISAAF